jgi:hypothetical protein
MDCQIEERDVQGAIEAVDDEDCAGVDAEMEATEGRLKRSEKQQRVRTEP